MNKRLLLRICFLSLLIIPLYSEALTLTVLDFEVQSSDNSHTYLGKGFAEFLSVELSGVREITLIERKKRNEIIDEMKFGLSGLADSEQLMNLGNLLLSNYLISGSIFDMSESLAVTGRVINVESGEIVVHASAEGTMGDYKSIVRTLTAEILAGLGIEETYAPVLTEKKDRDEQVLSTFSEAVDAYDKGDEEQAVEKLEQASKLDRSNRAVKRLINKLNTVSPKYQFEDPMWGSAYNPALAATLEEPLYYARWSSFDIYAGVNREAETSTVKDTGSGEANFASVSYEGSAHVGVLMPLSTGLGFSLELNMAVPGEDIILFNTNDFDFDANRKTVDVVIDGKTVASGDQLILHEGYWGSTAGFSYAFGDSLALGANASIFIPAGGIFSFMGQSKEGNVIALDEETVYTLPDELGWGIGFGLIFKPLGDALYLDISGLIPAITRYYYDLDQDSFIDGSYPQYYSAAINSTLIKNTLFFGLKSNFDLYTDQEAGGYYIRETPVAELWLDNNIALRGGYIFSYININDIDAVGHGGLFGLTLKFGETSLDFNINHRDTPLHTVGGYTIPHTSMLISLSR